MAPAEKPTASPGRSRFNSFGIYPRCVVFSHEFLRCLKGKEVPMSRFCLLVLSLLLAALPVNGQTARPPPRRTPADGWSRSTSRPTARFSWSGTLRAPNARHTNGPFATFDHARAVVQSLNKAGVNRWNRPVPGRDILPPRDWECLRRPTRALRARESFTRIFGANLR